MSKFTNTVEVIGDEQLARSIIERTVTEYKDNSVTSISHRAFRNCKNLVIVDCPNAAIDKIGTHAFFGCSALKSVNVDIETYSMTMGPTSAFEGCTSLEEIRFSGYLAQSIFAGCASLRKIDLLRGAVDGYNWCGGCTALVALIIRDTSAVSALRSSTKLNGTPIAAGTGYIYVPSSLVDSYKTATNWSTYSSQFRGLFDDESIQQGIIDGTLVDLNNNEIEEIPNSGFRSYQNLKSVSSTSATTVGSHAFYGCGALESINLPNVTTIDKNSFANCPQLKSLILPSVISAGGNSLNCLAEYIKLQSLTGLGSWAFNGTKCVILDLPSVAYISKNGISNPQSLKALVLRITSSICTLGGTFDSYFNNANIYVPRALIEEYKVANNWSTYADKFRALEDYTVDGTVTGALDETKI